MFKSLIDVGTKDVLKRLYCICTQAAYIVYQKAATHTQSISYVRGDFLKNRLLIRWVQGSIAAPESSATGSYELNWLRTYH